MLYSLCSDLSHANHSAFFSVSNPLSHFSLVILSSPIYYCTDFFLLSICVYVAVSALCILNVVCPSFFLLLWPTFCIIRNTTSERAFSFCLKPVSCHIIHPLPVDFQCAERRGALQIGPRKGRKRLPDDMLSVLDRFEMMKK